MHKKFEIIWTKINGGCQSGRKEVTHNSNSDLSIDSFGQLIQYSRFKKSMADTLANDVYCIINKNGLDDTF